MSCGQNLYRSATKSETKEADGEVAQNNAQVDNDRDANGSCADLSAYLPATAKAAACNMHTSSVPI